MRIPIVMIGIFVGALTTTASGVDVLDCLKEGDCWLSAQRPVLVSDSLGVPGWSRLYLERKPEREDVDDCMWTNVNDAFIMHAGSGRGFEIVGCSGDFNGDSRRDYCLLLRRQTDGGLTPHVFLATSKRYQTVPLEPLLDPYRLPEDSTRCPGPYALPLPENRVFDFETDDGSYQYRAVGELIQVGWHTYAWTDSGFRVAYMAD